MLSELQQQFDEVEHQREALQSSVLRLNTAQLNWSPSDAVWSIQKIVEHLVLSDETLGQAHMAGEVKSEGLMFRLIPRAWRRALILRAFSRNTILPLPSPEVEPRGNAALPEILSRWIAARSEMRRVLDMLQGDERLYFHPVMGPLSAAQMLAINQEHTAYHTRQIEALQQDTAFPGNC